MTAWRHAVPTSLRHAASAWLAGRASDRFQRELASMAAGQRPIVAGPWLGEVGFELLYWIPFLRWFTSRFGVGRDRLVVVSRGGTASWYQSFASRYCDVFDHVTPDVFRREHDERVRTIGEQKQRRASEFDATVIASVARRAQLADWSLLHPSSMYDLFDPYWWGHVPVDWVHRHALYAPLPEAPAEPFTRALAPYVAVKFYFNDCFPATDANREFARETLRTLSSKGPVVVLSTGLDIDDHSGVQADGLDVHYLPSGLAAARNLEVQSAVVAHARAFVGTYGGFSYLAPFHRVKSVALFSKADGFSRKHLHVVQSALDRIGASELLSVDDCAEGVSAIERGLAVTA